MSLYILLILFSLLSFLFLINKNYVFACLICFNTYLLVPVFKSKILYFDLFFLAVVLISVFHSNFDNISNLRLRKNTIIFIIIFLIVLFVPILAYFNFDVFLYIIRKLQLLFLVLLLVNSGASQIKLLQFQIYSLILFSLNFIILLFQKFNYQFFLNLKLVSNFSESGLYNDSTEFGPIFLLYFTFFSILIFYKQMKFNLLTFCLLFILSSGIIISNSRTSLLILAYPIFLIFFRFRSKFIYSVPILFFFIDQILLLSPKNSRIITDVVENGISSIFQADTFTLRMINWNSLLNYFSNNCNPIMGCGYTFEKKLEKILISDQGVFSIDNTFVRLIFSSGYLGLLFYSLSLFYLFLKCNLKLLIPVFILLSLTQEALQSLPIILNLILISVFSYKFKCQYIS